MAFKPVLGNTSVPTITVPAQASAFVMGDLVVRNTDTGRVQPAYAALADATVIEGIAQKTQTPSAGDFIEITPILSGLYVEADCTANTATNQLCKAHLLTDAATINNTSTHSTDKDAVFIALNYVGTASTKKLFGYVAKLGQVLS